MKIRSTEYPILSVPPKQYSTTTSPSEISFTIDVTRSSVEEMTECMLVRTIPSLSELAQNFGRKKYHQPGFDDNSIRWCTNGVCNGAVAHFLVIVP
jgi:hypothetical protein